MYDMICSITMDRQIYYVTVYMFAESPQRNEMHVLVKKWKRHNDS